MIKKIFPYVITVTICFVLGFIASSMQSDAIDNWYPHLNKPALTPPNWMFPVAWSIIYLLSGWSAGIIWKRAGASRRSILTLWGVQQFFNFTWSIVFFVMKNPELAFANIIILDVLVIWYIMRTWPISRAASLMFWPYLVWLCLATYLNGYIMVMN